MKNTKRIALSGILAALSVAIVYIATVTDLFSLSGCLAAAVAVLFIKVEYGTGTALSVYAVVSVLLWLLLPDKSIAAIYTFAAGLYPIVKPYFERIKHAPLRWGCKLASYNAVLAALYFAAMALLAPEADAPWMLAVTLVLANAVFILSDKLIDRLTLIYNIKFRAILRRRGIL